MTVLINGAVTAQPTVLTEETIQLQTDQLTLDGSMVRNSFGQKRQATLEWDWLTPVQYQTLLAYFTTGSGVSYRNTASDYAGGMLTFSGLPSFQESEYIRGGSLYRNFQATIRET